MKNKKTIAVVGAGLCGTLLAIRLKQRGHEVELFEKRPDMRRSEISAGRSINLALSNRGLKALRMIGMEQKARSITIPMRGRMLHSLKGELRMSPYSGRDTDFINSISRGDLNTMLYDEAESLGIKIHFNTGCVDSNPDTGNLKFETHNGKTFQIEAEAVFGADGAGSVIRQAAMERSTSLRFNFSQDFLTHGYKELSIPPGPGKSFRIEKNALHIWPRKTFMMIGLPNPDATFTMTLFLPFEGEDGFNAIVSEDDIVNYFRKWFPDAIPHMPELIKEYHQNPTSSLGTIRCYPWKTGDRTLLIGDAAHAIVPFYGQGMNCAFEDVVVLDKIMDQTSGDWGEIFNRFQEERKPDADAIADLAIDNFIEMRDKVADPVFMRKRELEMKLEKKYPGYYSKYSLVTFREDLSYSEAMNRGRRQDEILLDICRKEVNTENINLEKVMDSLTRLN